MNGRKGEILESERAHRRKFEYKFTCTLSVERETRVMEAEKATRTDGGETEMVVGGEAPVTKDDDGFGGGNGGVPSASTKTNGKVEEKKNSIHQIAPEEAPFAGGGGDAAAAAGLKGMSHPNDLIDHGASEQPLRVTLLCPRALALLTKLEAAAKTKGGGKRKLQDATVCVRDPDMPDRMVCRPGQLLPRKTVTRRSGRLAASGQ